MSYYLSTLLSTLLIYGMAAAVCLGYLFYAGWYLTTGDVGRLLLDVFLLVRGVFEEMDNQGFPAEVMEAIKDFAAAICISLRIKQSQIICI